MNGLFIILIFLTLIALDFAFTIGDDIAGGVNDKLTDIGLSNPISTAGLNAYTNVRGLLYGLATGVMTPFLILLSFGSTFINRNQNIVTYIVQVIGVLFLTPLCIYMFAELMTNILAVNVLDPQYIATSYFDNFMFIMVLNMLLGLASFVFVQRGVVYET